MKAGTIDLRVLNLHWLGEDNHEHDLCAHGCVYLRIGEKRISDETSGDWTVSAASYYLLKTLRENHDGNADNQLIPCCGMPEGVLSGVEPEPLLVSCPNGINWTITHKPGVIVHRFEDGDVIETEFDTWKMAVCEFSNQVMDFFRASAPKKASNFDEEKAFEIFMQKWTTLKDQMCRRPWQ